MSKFEISESVNEDGETIVEIVLDSNLLPVLNIDTYQCFNGDSWVESEIEHFMEETGKDLDYDDFEWQYDHAGIVKALAEASAETVLDQLASDGVITGVDVQSVYSPREYNFATDSYRALWTVNLSKLDQWCKESAFDPDAFATEHYSSYDGFISFVPAMLEDDREGTVIWLKIDAYLRSEYDEERSFYNVAEAEWEAYSNNVTVTPKEA
jgi:hypothetical protein